MGMMGKEKTTGLTLTEGPILKTLFRLAAPIMATAFLSTAYNLTDAFWVGQLGADAVAGVGTGGMYIWLSGGLITLARTGGQVYAAQSIGMGDFGKAANYARASLRLAALTGLLYGLICFFFTGQMLSFFRLNDALTFAYARDYLRICGIFLVFLFLTSVMSSLFTAQADSKTPFLCNVLGLLINMLLDPLLIGGHLGFPRLEAKGAALATVVAQLSVFLTMVIAIKRSKSDVHLLKHPFAKVHAPDVKKILMLSLPHAVQSTLYPLFSMILARLIAPFGDGAIAVQRIGGQIEALSWNVADGFASSLNAFTAQNKGAGKPERYIRGYDYSATLLTGWGVLIALLFVLGAYPIASAFFHAEDVRQIAVSYLRIISICEPFMCVEILTIGALSALEKTKLSGLISVTLTGARIPLVLLLIRAGLQVSAFWWTLSVTSVAKGIVFFIAYRVVTKSSINLVNQKTV